MKKCFLLTVINILLGISECCENNTFVGFVVLSQPNDYHEKNADLIKEDILNQVSALKTKVNVYVFKSHKDFGNILGHWTILPLFHQISHFGNAGWLFFLEDHTNINVRKVLEVLSCYRASNEIFAGYALRDINPTIIHHFADTGNDTVLMYPHFSAGFFISMALVKRLTSKPEDSNFSIDPKYELAKHIWKTAGIKLTPESRLCLSKKSNSCATWTKNRFPNCGTAVEPNKIFVSVKTCKKFHKERVTVLKNTWGSDVKNIHFFSDGYDKSLPSIKLDVENTASGHCEKTFAIMDHYVQRNIEFDWLTIVDDDTLLSFPRLSRLLACYNADKDVVLGERYGYAVFNDMGYNYPTGGSGMVFTKSTLEKLVHHCRCPSPDSPDDMIIGLCLKNLNIPVIHSPFFHQARPIDYSTDFLSLFDHVSFHKHWMIDPYTVYRDWLQEKKAHDEL